VTPLPALAAYRLLAGTYDDSPNALLSLERRTLGDLLPDVEGCEVLDAASGTGYWANYCTERGARAIAVDFCAEMLVRAPRPAVLADVNQIPLPSGIADITICAFGLGYAPRCMGELARVTRTGGIVIVSDVHPDAVQRGWTRSFRHQGRVIDVRHEPYRLQDLGARDLELTAIREPNFGKPEREIFREAGKLAEFDRAASQPAIFVARWVRL
jgi:SAM-dependent methyltransferase